MKTASGQQPKKGGKNNNNNNKKTGQEDSLQKPRDKEGSGQSEGLGLMRSGFGVQIYMDSLSCPGWV